jgi:tetratricopeptide (TPR) repeat protein
MDASRNRTKWKGLTLALALAGLFSGSWLRGQASDLGRIDFPTSGSSEAQKHFLRGALLLHSFEYDDAAEEFREAQKLEPGFAMAYWGEAETANHPIWVERDAESARKILNRLAPTPEARQARAPTPREKGYLDAVEILFAEGKKPERDRAYAEAMLRLHQRYPDDLEAASFYALALLGTCQGQRDTATYMKAAAVAEEVFAKNPLHPGAVHYLIHSYDDPVHAPLGMRAARTYSKIAPAAGHAQHMCSHIFVAMGMWDDVVQSNETAVTVVNRRREKKGLPPVACGHYNEWLEYGYLEQGRFADAQRVLEGCRAEATSPAHAGHTGDANPGHSWLGSFVDMWSRYLIDTQQVKGHVASWSVSPGDLPGPRVTREYVGGLFASRRRDLAGTRTALERLGKSGRDLEADQKKREEADPSYANRAAILEEQLAALIASGEGRPEEAVGILRKAAAEEAAMPFAFGPPFIDKPTPELLGELLLELDRPAEARREFERSLEKAPGRALSLLGLARSAARAGDTAGARQAYAELAKNWQRADPDLPELAEVRKNL